jgi:hypothetical protein
MQAVKTYDILLVVACDGAGRHRLILSVQQHQRTSSIEANALDAGRRHTRLRDGSFHSGANRRPNVGTGLLVVISLREMFGVSRLPAKQEGELRHSRPSGSRSESSGRESPAGYPSHH